MIGRFLILICWIINSQCIFAQHCEITFIPKFGNSDLDLNQTYLTADHLKIEISSIKFYISKVEFLQNDSLVWKENNNPKLINFNLPQTIKMKVDSKERIKFNRIKFNIGIDSVTNNAGAMGGDLDPTLGMYWTWQNGYINFKIEGKCDACPTRNNEFQYHIGGYSAPYNTLQQISLPVAEIENILVEIDFEKIFTFLYVPKVHHIMSPGEEAVKFANQLSKMFSIKKR